MSKYLAVIVDYDSGNLHSAEKAFALAGANTGHEVILSSNAEDIRRADHVLLPGVGAFGDCAAGLKSVDNMVEALDEHVHRKGRPFMGICVGMQLLAEDGLERGAHKGLGWVEGSVEKIAPSQKNLKVPHMGWNKLDVCGAHPVLEGVASGEQVYFVHSYHMRAKAPADVVATVDYGMTLTAFIARDNLVGAQFHPEKSQRAGLRIIENFLRWRP